MYCYFPLNSIIVFSLLSCNYDIEKYIKSKYANNCYMPNLKEIVGGAFSLGIARNILLSGTAIMLGCSTTGAVSNPAPTNTRPPVVETFKPTETEQKLIISTPETTPQYTPESTYQLENTNDPTVTLYLTNTLTPMLDPTPTLAPTQTSEPTPQPIVYNVSDYGNAINGFEQVFNSLETILGVESLIDITSIQQTNIDNLSFTKPFNFEVRYRDSEGKIIDSASLTSEEFSLLYSSGTLFNPDTGKLTDLAVQSLTSGLIEGNNQKIELLASSGNGFYPLVSVGIDVLPQPANIVFLEHFNIDISLGHDNMNLEAVVLRSDVPYLVNVGITNNGDEILGWDFFVEFYRDSIDPINYLGKTDFDKIRPGEDKEYEIRIKLNAEEGIHTLIAYLPKSGEILKTDVNIVSAPTELTVPHPLSGIDPYYTKSLYASGMTIVSSEKVRDEALYLAKENLNELLNDLTLDRYARIMASGAKLTIIPQSEKLTDLPEYRHLKGEIFPDGRKFDDFRGFYGGGIGDPVAIGEEILLDLPGNRKSKNATYHEGGHLVRRQSFTKDDILIFRHLYNTSVEKNLFSDNSYMMSNEGEFFAELTLMFKDPLIYRGGPEAIKNADPNIFSFMRYIYNNKPLPQSLVLLAK